MAEPKPKGSQPVAEVIDAVRWDYDPEADEVSPLLPAEQYFRDFPWEGDEEPVADESGA